MSVNLPLRTVEKEKDMSEVMSSLYVPPLVVSGQLGRCVTNTKREIVYYRQIIQ